MRKTVALKLCFPLVSVLLSTGCASIFSDNKYPVAVRSYPSGAAYEVHNQSGALVHSGVTPDQVTLKSNVSYFDGETYKITFRKDGYFSTFEVLDSGIDRWYWANFGLLDIIGLLIIDPSTGAMYTLPETVLGKLEQKPAAVAFAVP